jgi:Ca2+-binding EF-hand superfamily protein
MGQSQSADLTDEQIEELRRSTNFTQREIRTWHEKFKEDFPDGVITKEAFVCECMQCTMQSRT